MGKAINYIYTHAHIYLEDFDKDRKDVLERAEKAGIDLIILPAIDMSTFDAMWQCYQVNVNLQKMMIGLHPGSVKEDYKLELNFIENQLQNNVNSFIGIGEIGMDLYWAKTYIVEQRIVLIQQLQWAIQYDLPVCIHQRNSLHEIISILDEFSNKPRGIFHCFTGTYEEAKIIIDRGFMLGIGGIITFKNNKLAQTISQIGLDYLVLETDAPYLTPVPYRGKRNESSFIPHIAKKIAEILKIDIKKVAFKTTMNAKNLFSL